MNQSTVFVTDLLHALLLFLPRFLYDASPIPHHLADTAVAHHDYAGLSCRRTVKTHACVGLPPDAERRLRGAFPKITGGMMQIAQCVACGLTNKQIASLLRIQPDSVRKSRYRLRSAIGLKKGDSLERFLKDFISGDH